ncbi:MAG: DNA polymerase [Gammaproteobacteria bacterium]|tara:strand:+ start:4163 stop:6019 length:1857 start_codon:yes stop_codon:yes gene_type:complete
MFQAQTEWTCPDTFPDLSKYEYVAIDLETRDPNLKSKGSGAVIGDGEIIGVALAVEGWSGYYPIGHREGNLDKRIVLDYVRDVCKASNTKIFHNAMYDVCWLRAYNIPINGFIVDTMVMSSLIDENRLSYALNSIAFEYLREVKDEKGLKEAAEAAGVDAKSEMYKLPAMYVGSYAEKDAELTLRLFKILSVEIQKQNLSEIFDLETQLFPCLIDMKFKGVRVNVEGAQKLKQDMLKEEEALLLEVKKQTGVDTQIWAARSIAKVFDKLDLDYERTQKTQAPSFTKNFLSEHKHPLVQKIAKAREINKAHTTFIDTILKHEHRGRIHADINPIRSDQGGTVTGRFSYSNPNLQQIPARNKDLGPKIRSLFLPEENHTWGCFDYSQQEPRLVVHYAATTDPIMYDQSVTNIVNKFKSDSVDFHQTVADMAGISRSNAKTINLGLFYGMGKAKLQAELGLSTKEEAENLFNQYHENVPFVRELMNRTSSHAQFSGSIGTLLGRRCRFNKWEPSTFGMHTPMSLEEAERTYGRGRIKRAFTYKALNKLIQGSAADMTKKAMLDLYKEGIIPHIQIHDELDISIESEAQAKKIIEIMENAVKLAVPNKVDYEYGNTWGEIHG